MESLSLANGQGFYQFHRKSERPTPGMAPAVNPPCLAGNRPNFPRPSPTSCCQFSRLAPLGRPLPATLPSPPSSSGCLERHPSGNCRSGCGHAMEFCCLQPALNLRPPFWSRLEHARCLQSQPLTPRPNWQQSPTLQRLGSVETALSRLPRPKLTGGAPRMWNRLPVDPQVR